MRLAALLVAAACVANAQTWKVQPAKPLEVKRLHFVLDVSGSMEHDMSKLLETVKALAPPGSDELAIKVTVFSEGFKTWERGKNGWVDLPGPDDMKAARDLIDATYHGETRVMPAVAAALADPGEPCTVVLVTDGIFWQEVGVELRISARAKASRHALLIVGAGNEQPCLESIAKASGAGYLTRKQPKE